MSSDPLQVVEDDKLYGRKYLLCMELKDEDFWCKFKSLGIFTIIKRIPTTFLGTYDKHILLEIQL